MRTIEAIKLKTDTEINTAKFVDNPATWLVEYNTTLFSDAYLLSFHDDGVVWGKIKGSQLRTSDELKDINGKPFPSPEFRHETLQECRLFSDQGELYMWRSDSSFKARLIEDDKTASKEEMTGECFDEKQVLWGTKVDGGNDEFTIVADGSEGLRHAFPQLVDPKKFDGKKRPLRLGVRHYLSYDDDDCAYISLSRLVNVKAEGGN